MPKNKDTTLSFVNLLEEPILILSANFVILDLNTSAEKIFKIKKNALIGKPFSILCPTPEIKTQEQLADVMFGNEEKSLLWGFLYIKISKDNEQIVLARSIMHIPTHLDH